MKYGRKSHNREFLKVINNDVTIFYNFNEIKENIKVLNKIVNMYTIKNIKPSGTSKTVQMNLIVNTQKQINELIEIIDFLTVYEIGKIDKYQKQLIQINEKYLNL